MSNPSLDQIYQSLNSSYQPQRDLIQQQIQALPGQYTAQQQGIEGQKNLAFRQIDDQANARGMIYSGAPTQEDRDYTQSTYAPALANLANQQNQQQYGLQSALAQLGQQQQQQAYNQYNTGLQNDMQQKYYDQQIALAQQQANMYKNMYGGGSYGQAAPAYNYTPQAAPQVGYSAPKAAPKAAPHPSFLQSAGHVVGTGLHDIAHFFHL